MTSTGLIVAAAVLVLGTATGLWRRRSDGRLRSAARVLSAVTVVAPVASERGSVMAASDRSVTGAVDPSAFGRDHSASGQQDPSARGRQVDAELLAALGVGPARATLLQFSSAFCAPCRALRRVSSEVAELLPGVQHVEVDAESHLDAVRALGIWRTPTLLVLDADGRIAKRATGVPAKPQLIAVLGEILPA